MKAKVFGWIEINVARLVNLNLIYGRGTSLMLIFISSVCALVALVLEVMFGLLTVINISNPEVFRVLREFYPSFLNTKLGNESNGIMKFIIPSLFTIIVTTTLFFYSSISVVVAVVYIVVYYFFVSKKAFSTSEKSKYLWRIWTPSNTYGLTRFLTLIASLAVASLYISENLA